MDYRTNKKSTVLIGLTALLFMLWGMPAAEAFIWPKIVGGQGSVGSAEEDVELGLYLLR